MLELLLVCTIIGVMGTLGFSVFARATNTAKIAEASAQLTADFRRARSSAQRSNQNATLAFATTTAVTEYTLTLDGQAAVTRKLPVGTEVTVPTAAKTITYTAPFGEVSSVSTAIYTLKSKRDPTLVRYLKIVGLTGKAYPSEIQP